MASTVKLDAIQLEILRARVGEIIETARHLLFHSGYSTILRETQDGSVTLCALDGTVIHSGGGPLQTFGYHRTVQGVLKSHPIETMHEGDCYISSDPYQGGMLHVPDVAIVTPIFVDGKAIGFVVSHAHKPDFGGLVPGSSGAGSREIFHDGLLLPGVLYWTKDGVNKDMEAIIKANCRIPEVIEGDLRAQVGCTLVGVESVKKLCAEFGTDVVTTAFQEFLERSAQRIRDGLKGWPDGESEAECWIDHDGVDIDKPLRLHVKVIKKGDHITFDYSETAHQVKGPTNLRPQASEVAALVALVSLLDATIPANGGASWPITFINPEGKITNPKWPAPVNNYFGLTNVLCSTVQQALSKFSPDKQIASPGLGLGAIAVGYDQGRHAGRKAVQYEVFLTAQGGKMGFDGSSGLNGFMNGTPNTPIEVTETEFPIRVLGHEWIQDSPGAGKYRGGLGNRKTYELLGDATVTIRLGHNFEHGGWGVRGGDDPDTVKAFINKGTNRERALRPLETVRMSAGDTFTIEMPGGGGYENPKARPPEQVLDDVLNGYVSIEKAAERYGVAIDPVTKVIDQTATRRLRA